MALSDSARVHRNRLARMRNVKTASLKKLYEAGEIIRKDAADSIKEGAISGPGHIPSAPGTPPNADTHELDKGIDVRIRSSRLTVDVVSTARYSAALEFGTSRMAARPFLRPALQRNRNRVVIGQVQAVNEVVRVYKSQGAFDRAAARYAARDDDENSG